MQAKDLFGTWTRSRPACILTLLHRGQQGQAARDRFAEMPGTSKILHALVTRLSPKKMFQTHFGTCFWNEEVNGKCELMCWMRMELRDQVGSGMRQIHT